MLFLIYSINIKHPISRLFASVCAAFMLFCCSCNQNQDKTAPDAIDYDKIVDSAKELNNTNNELGAIHYLDSIVYNYKNPSFLTEFYYLSFHSAYYQKYNNDAKAMLYADSLLATFDTPEKKLKYMPYYGQAHYTKGDILFDQGNYNDAYLYYYQAKMIGSKSLDDCTLSDYDYRIGMIMYKLEHYRQAAAAFKESSKETYACYLDFGSFYRRQELLNNTALSYSKANMADSAMFFFGKTLRYLDSVGVRFKVNNKLLDVARGVVYGNEANEYIKRGNLNQAKSLLQKSIAINLRKGNDNHDAELSELKLAHIYERQNKPDSLLYVLQTTRKQFDSVKNDEAKADWFLTTANYLNKKGQADSAYNYLIKYDALKDTVTIKSRQLKEADITVQMERLKKNYEFEQLKKHNQQQYYYLITAIVLGVMLVIIISLIFLNWQKSKRNIKVLGNLNNQINDQNYDLEQALGQLRLSSQEKDRILRTVAHDLRNPVGGIASLTGLMAEESEYNDEQKELINLIKETSNNSLELINEILEITDNISTKLNKEKEIVEINSLLNKSVELLRFKAAEKHQQIILELMDTPVELLIGREKIWRVISNLISNAIKFSNENSPIHVTLTDEGSEVKIAVADNGIGIPDDIKPRVFNTFTDAKRPGTAGEKSFGLGLSICYQIIENHDGKIWFDSEVGKGTTFYVTLKK
jgi:signal transduction histidine kinase